MPILSHHDNVCTLVNVFTVKPENQDRVVELLVRATHDTMQYFDGFISANIHKSDDGKRVINYAQWRSREDFQAMLQNADAKQHMEEVKELVESFDPITCELVDSKPDKR